MLNECLLCVGLFWEETRKDEILIVWIIHWIVLGKDSNRFSFRRNARHNKLFISFLFITDSYHVEQKICAKKTIEVFNYSRTTFPASSDTVHRARERERRFCSNQTLDPTLCSFCLLRFPNKKCHTKRP